MEVESALCHGNPDRAQVGQLGLFPFQTPSRAKTQPYQPATMPDAFDEFTAALDDWFQNGQNVVPIIIVTGLATMFAVSWLVRCFSLPCSLMRQQPDLLPLAVFVRHVYGMSSIHLPSSTSADAVLPSTVPRRASFTRPTSSLPRPSLNLSPSPPPRPPRQPIRRRRPWIPPTRVPQASRRLPLL